MLEESEQIHVALSTCTERESFDIVLEASPSGLGGLRRLIRRWDRFSGAQSAPATCDKSWV